MHTKQRIIIRSLHLRLGDAIYRSSSRSFIEYQETQEDRVELQITVKPTTLPLKTFETIKPTEINLQPSKNTILKSKIVNIKKNTEIPQQLDSTDRPKEYKTQSSVKLISTPIFDFSNSKSWDVFSQEYQEYVASESTKLIKRNKVGNPVLMKIENQWSYGEFFSYYPKTRRIEFLRNETVFDYEKGYI